MISRFARVSLGIVESKPEGYPARERERKGREADTSVEIKRSNKSKEVRPIA